MTEPETILLRQVAGEDLPGILPEEFLEDGCESYHRFSSTQLGALHHTLFVIHKEVSTAGQYCSTLLRASFGGALCPEISHKPVNQLTQIPAEKRRKQADTHAWIRALIKSITNIIVFLLTTSIHRQNNKRTKSDG